MFKALRLVSKTDWRSLLLLITALTGALGFVWNKVELYVQQAMADEVALDTKANKEAAGGAYEALATRLDELFFKVEGLEAKLNVKADYVPVEPTVPEPKPEPDAVADEPVATAAGGGVGDTTAELVGSIMKREKPPEPVSKKFSRARLPEYNSIQQQAQQGELEDFISEVKAK